MKSLKKILFVAAAFFFISAANRENIKYNLSKDYSVTILGTSNLHNWNETVGNVNGDCKGIWNDDGSFNLEAFSLKIDVHSIKSEMGRIMDNSTYKALKADEYPEIEFSLNTPVRSIRLGKSISTISANGFLTIAGMTNPVTMQIRVLMPKQGELSFEGSQIIKMTDYGVAPPTALLGVLKTGNEITINFKTNFSLGD